MNKPPRVILRIYRAGTLDRRVCLDRAGHYLVGRGPDSAIRLGDSYVSKRQFCVTLAASGATIRDLGSINGTEIDGVIHGGRRAATSGEESTAGYPAPNSATGTGSPVPLRDGSVIRIGEIRITVSVEEPVMLPEAEPESPAPAASNDFGSSADPACDTTHPPDVSESREVLRGVDGVLLFIDTCQPTCADDPIRTLHGKEYPCRLIAVGENDAQVTVTNFSRSLYFRLVQTRASARVRMRIDVDPRHGEKYYLTGMIRWSNYHLKLTNACIFGVQLDTPLTAERLERLRLAVEDREHSGTH